MFLKTSVKSLTFITQYCDLLLTRVKIIINDFILSGTGSVMDIDTSDNRYDECLPNLPQKV